MVRTFETHKIRVQKELLGLWDFTAKDYDTIKVAVPSCWESYPNYRNYRGEASYETEFLGKGNIRVVCKGVSHTADVFIDGEKIAHHYNAYTPFDGISKRLEKGMHKIKIDVSNEFSDKSALHIPNDYHTYGGITRAVIVEEVPDVFIEWVHITPIKNKAKWSAKIDIRINNIGTAPHKATLKTKINEQVHIFDECNIPAGANIVLSKGIDCEKVETYEIDNPKLYLAETVLYLDDQQNPVDDLIERCGFRTVEIRDKDLLLNEKKLRIKGFNRHEDHPQFGCALPFSAMDYDLNIMKDLGANAVRTSHYPNDELFLDLCDEKGILVWEENHARGLSEEDMKNEHFRRQCADCIDEMINAHFNHPAIIIWGILNECASETQYGKECYAEQFEQIKMLDTSRPTSFASCKFNNDISLGLPDFVSYNIYPRWYHNASVKQYLDGLYSWVQTTEGVGKPFLITEIGAGAIYGNRSADETKWSEERQAKIITEQLNTVLDKAECFGVFIWQFCDVRVSEEWFASRPRTMNNKGIVDEYRRPKVAYNTVKSIFKSFGNYR